jgi:hypothetical protein
MRLLTLVFLFAVITTSTYGQRYIDSDTPWNFQDRAYAGIGFGGLSFGKHPSLGSFFSAGASVLGGYMLTKNMSSGLAVEYQYTSYSDLKLRNHLYGGYPFVRYNIKNFFLQADYAMYSVQVDLRDAGERELLDRFFIGIGYFSESGNRGTFNFLVSYDFLYDNTSRWGTPLNTRLFFTF